MILVLLHAELVLLESTSTTEVITDSSMAQRLHAIAGRLMILRSLEVFLAVQEAAHSLAHPGPGPQLQQVLVHPCIWADAAPLSLGSPRGHLALVLLQQHRVEVLDEALHCGEHHFDTLALKLPEAPLPGEGAE